VAEDDFRIRIELPEEGPVERVLERLHLDLGSEARHLAQELEGHRLAVSRDGNDLFVYTASRQQAEQALAVIESELREEGVEARTSQIEQWLQDRWTGDEAEATFEEELLAEGYAPWEVRVECRTRDEARRLEDRLAREGYGVARRWRYVFAGTETEEEAHELAARLHGEVEPSDRLVWETLPQNPFAVFGGLGGTGTPL
jgi:16S rRNA C967 or C1407 C5-methylase (RsmB/RsmF family)